MRRLAQPDPNDIEIETVHCFGCGRMVGVARKKTDVFCEDLCWHQEQLVSLENAARDRMIRVLVEHGVGHREIAEMFGITRTRIVQVMAAPADENYLLAGRRGPTTEEERARKARAGRLGGQATWKSRK